MCQLNSSWFVLKKTHTSFTFEGLISLSNRKKVDFTYIIQFIDVAYMMKAMKTLKVN
jgi:hypothetical protein